MRTLNPEAAPHNRGVSRGCLVAIVIVPVLYVAVFGGLAAWNRAEAYRSDKCAPSARQVNVTPTQEAVFDGVTYRFAPSLNADYGAYARPIPAPFVDAHYITGGVTVSADTAIRVRPLCLRITAGSEEIERRLVEPRAEPADRKTYAIDGHLPEWRPLGYARALLYIEVGAEVVVIDLGPVAIHTFA